MPAESDPTTFGALPIPPLPAAGALLIPSLPTAVSETAMEYPSGPLTVREAMPDAPVSEDALMPAGYGLDAEAGMIVETVPRSKTPVPLVEAIFVKREMRLDTGAILLELAIRIKGGWKTVTMPAEAAASKRDLVRVLAAQGLTVDDANARGVLEFLRRYRRVNGGCIPVALVYNRSGWLSCLPPRAIAVGLHVVGAGAAGVVVRATSEGEAQILGHYVCEGDEIEVRRLMGSIAGDAPVWIALYAAILPMLLRLLNRETVIFVEMVGDTSTGKTTALIWVASMYGKPGGNGRRGLVMGWQQTGVALERRATLTPDMPLFFDELTTEDKPRLESNLYGLATGQGKARGSLDGLRETGSYCGVVFSTGETSILSCTRKGGIGARTITIDEPPFGDGDRADLVRDIQRACANSHGHVALRVAEYLASLSDVDIVSLGDRLCTIRAEFQAEAADRISGRMAGTMALVALAGEVLHRVIGIAGDPSERVRAFWQRAAPKYAEEIPLWRRVYDFIVSWCSENRSKFLSGAGDTDENQPGDVWGLVESDGSAITLVVARSTLDRELNSAGFSARTATTELKRHGLLVHDQDKLTSKRTIPGPGRVACYVVCLDSDDHDHEPKCDALPRLLI
jgi:hypothetical protein